MKVSLDQVLKIAKTWKNSQYGASKKDIRLSFFVSDTASRDLLRDIRDAFVPQTPHGKLYIAGFGQTSGMPTLNKLAHVALVIAGDNLTEAEALYRASASHRVPCAIVVDTRLVPHAAQELGAFGVSVRDIIAVKSDACSKQIAEWLLGKLDEHESELVTNFVCCKDVVSRTTILTACRDNALIGALQFLGRAETPLMLTNEVAMASKLSSVYNQKIEPKRLAEVAGLSAYSLVARGAARAVLKAVPLPAWLLKPAVAFGTTYVAGKALDYWYGSLGASADSAKETTQNIVSGIQNALSQFTPKGQRNDYNS